MRPTDSQVRAALLELRGEPIAEAPFYDRCDWEIEQTPTVTRLVLKVQSPYVAELVKGLAPKQRVNLKDVIKAIGGKSPPGMVEEKHGLARLVKATQTSEDTAELRFERLGW